MVFRFLLFCLCLGLSSCATPESAHSSASISRDVTATKPSKTIVLIHGMFFTPDSWAEWKSYFQQAGYTVHAPAWPMHDAKPADLRSKHPDPALGKLKLDQVINSYRSFIKTLPEKPILIGHSMGGLVVQKLVMENLGTAGVAINSAPPSGLISLRWSFLKSNWPVISPFADEDQPYLPTEDEFHYSFANCVGETESNTIYQRLVSPESRHVGLGPTTDVAEIDFDTKTIPLLFIAGGEDHTVPASLNYANFERYDEAPSLTEFKLFSDRCHWIIGQTGWQEVAGFVKKWIE